MRTRGNCFEATRVKTGIYPLIALSLVACSDPEAGDTDGTYSQGLTTEHVCDKVSRPRLLTVEFTNSQGVPAIAVRNRADAPATTTITATSFGDEGTINTSLPDFTLAPGEVKRVPLDPAALRLPIRRALLGGTVVFTARGTYADGRRTANASDPVYYSMLATGSKPQLSATPNFRVEHLRGEYRERFKSNPNSALDVALTKDQRSGASTQANVTKSLCFRLIATYLDSAIGEDTWATVTPTARYATAMKVKINGVNYTLGTTGGMEGCVNASFSTGSQTVFLYTEGTVGGHLIQIKSASGTVGNTQTTINVTSSTNTQIFDLDITGRTYEAQLNMYPMVTYAVRRNPGNGTGTITVVHDGTGSFYSGGVVRIAKDDEADEEEGPGDTGDSREKFTIAHELGHAILADSGGTVPATYTYTGHEPCDSASDAHGLFSAEYQVGAITEGFGNFYAADTFNSDTADADCSFQLTENGTVVNCETPNAAFPDKYLETNCDDDENGNDWDGLGNEVDWAKTFWDVHTDSTSHPSMYTIIAWIEDADDTTAWTSTNGYDLLEARANVLGGNVNTRWDVSKTYNGVDH